MACMMLALMLYILILVNRASCQTLSKDFLKSMKTLQIQNFGVTKIGDRVRLREKCRYTVKADSEQRVSV